MLKISECERLKKGQAVSVKIKQASLSLVIDKDGRLKYLEYLPYYIRYPIIFVKSYDDDSNHSAYILILSNIFWIVSCRETIRNVHQAV